MRPLIRLFVVVALITAIAGGCYGGHKNKSSKGPDFDTRGPDQARICCPGVPFHSKPIVRVIKGETVENLQDARRKLIQQNEPRFQGMNARLKSLILQDVDVRVIAKLLTELCGYNVVATNTVANFPVTIYLRDLTLREALEAICRLNNLWYREGQGIITLMTRQEYVQDIEERQSDQTRAFYIRYTNAADMAKVIQAAMGEEVHLEVIKDEEIYGHLDPEKDAQVSSTYKVPQLESPTPAELESAGLPSASGGNAASSRNSSAADQKGKRPLLAILTVFKRNNCIVARSLDASLLNEMARIIEALDTPTSQVLLEIKILQVTLDDGFESFFDFSYNATGSTSAFGAHEIGLGLGGATSPSSTTMNFVFSSDDLYARIAFFQEEGRAEIIGTPFLMAANNSKVEFFVGEETPLRNDVTTTTVAVGDQGNTMTTFQVEIIREELGTDVDMTTFINADGTVTLDFEAEISSALLNYSSVTVVNPETGEALDFPLDGKGTSKIKSILSAGNGQSVAVGGIIRETLDLSERKVPLLGSIPLLGFFFREIDNSKRKTETVIVLTPHVIMHPAMAECVSAEFLGRRSSHETITEGKENILEGVEIKPTLKLPGLEAPIQ